MSRAGYRRSRLYRLGRILATGGFSLLERKDDSEPIRHTERCRSVDCPCFIDGKAQARGLTPSEMNE